MTVVSEDEAKEALRQRLGGGARYDAALAPAQELAWARHGTAYFARRLNELTDAELDMPAFLPRQLRRHVVAMVGYQARELALAVEAARTGVAPQEASPEDWREQAEMGATLPARALRNLFDHADVHLNVEWRDLGNADWQKSVTLDDSRMMPLARTPWLRARAIWVHAVDMGNGGSFLDFPPDLLDALLAEIAAKPMPPLRLMPTDRPQPIALGAGQGREVSGTTADLVRWLTGRGARRLDAPAGILPDLPLWT